MSEHNGHIMMNRRQFLKIAAGAAMGCWLGSSRAAATQSARPNFVFILVDDLGWRDLGCFGSSFYDTPHIDQLAKEGMRFTDAYAACPVCSPTRASIQTGKYPVRMGTTDWFGAPQPETAHLHPTGTKPLLPAPYNDRLPLEEITIAEALKAGGYATFFAGKWHLGGEGYYPETQGFDINIGGYEKGSPVSYFSPYGNPKLSDGPPGEHLPARLARESVHFLETRPSDRPFLLFLSFYSVHTPLQGRKDLVAKYKDRARQLGAQEPLYIEEHGHKVRQTQNHPVYGAMVEAMDEAVGDVLDALERLGLADSTAVFLTSDNGGLSTIGEGAPTSNVPLRAGKGWLYEGGIRVPLIAKWPGLTAPGSACSVPVISPDFYPTLLEMAGLHPASGQILDGTSLVLLLRGESSAPPRPLYWHYPHYGNQGAFPGGAVRLGDYKLIEFFEDGHQELYNLRDDLSETRDLRAEEPDRAAELVHLLHAWQKETGARFPSPNPNAGKGKII